MPVNPKSASTSLRRTACALALGLAFATSLPLAAQVTPAFTWQGELRSGGNPANASFDMEFRLYNAASGGSPIGPLVTRPSVAAVNGLFNVQLDFGPAQFAGDRQWLEVRIKPAGSGSYETLAPRTEMTATPYALGAVAALPNSVTTTSLVDATVQGVDIAPGAVGTAQVNAAQVQRRVSGSCAGSQGVQSIAADGTVSCGSFAGGTGTVTNVATGTGLTGGPVTSSGTISVAPGGIGATEIDSAQVQLRVSGACAGSNFVQQVNQDGSVACAPAGAASGWALTGNAGTDPGTNFIGTTDAQAFVVRTQNVPSLRIEPNVGTGGVVISANLLGGSSANSLTPGVRGATLSGGGVPAADSDPDLGSGSPNRITDHYGTVGGGFGNRAGDDAEPLFGAPFATVGGGRGNVSSGNASTVGGGWSNTAGDSLSSVGGGFFNNAAGNSSHVGGGQFNQASGGSSTIAGGSSNAASGTESAIGGGASNSATASRAAIGGGQDNLASGSHAVVGGGASNRAAFSHATVSGGHQNWAEGQYASVGGGENNQAGGSSSTVAGGGFNVASGLGSAIGGGASNNATQIVATIAGGLQNSAGAYATVGGGQDNIASGSHSVVGGGLNNRVNLVSAQPDYATIGGGRDNRATESSSTVSGGRLNTAGAADSTVSGGWANSASGGGSAVGGGEGNTASGERSTVGGGIRNKALGSDSIVAGGTGNYAFGDQSTVSGGRDNCAGARLSWAGGSQAKVRPPDGAAFPLGSACQEVSSGGFNGDHGTFVWADNQFADFVSTGSGQFLVRALGGIWLGTNNTNSIPLGRFINTSTGGFLSSGGTWTNASSRALKTGFVPVDVSDTLTRVLSLPLTRWEYRASPQEGEHLGPVAEDFHSAFGLGADGQSISTTDASGVALAAIQGLNAKLEAENIALRADAAELRTGQRQLAAELAELRALLRDSEGR